MQAQFHELSKCHQISRNFWKTLGYGHERMGVKKVNDGLALLWK